MTAMMTPTASFTQLSVYHADNSLARSVGASYDALGRLTQHIDGSGNVTHYQRDAVGRVTAITDPRGVRTGYHYDALGDLLQIASPDGGIQTHAFDVGGLLTHSQDALNQTTALTHDGGNRLSSVTYADGRGASFTCDQNTNGVGRLTTVSDSSGSTAGGKTPRAASCSVSATWAACCSRRTAPSMAAAG